MSKYVLFCNEYPPRPHAGIGTAVQTIARGLARNGHKLTILGVGAADADHFDGSIRVVTLRENPLPYVGNLLSRLRVRQWLSSFVKSGGTDLIEVPDSQGFLPFPIHGCPVVVRLHLSFSAVSTVTNEKAGYGIALYEGRTVRVNRNWIAVSNHILNLTKKTFGVSPERSVTIYNPVPPQPIVFPQVPNLPLNYVLYAGHVCKRKGADVLAHAMRKVMGEHPHLHLVYLGGVWQENDRPMSDLIRDILGPNLLDRVHFLGRLDRDKVLACMSRAKVFAFPSHVEGFPMVILEALNCGTPVVFSNLPPGPEIIEDGVTGLLANPSSHEDFSEKISRILNNTALATKLSDNSKNRTADLFSVEKCISSTELFYESCIAATKFRKT